MQLVLMTKEELPAIHVLWFSANNVGDLQESIGTIDEILSLTGGETHPNRFFAQFREWLLDPVNGEWFIVLDGFDFEQRPLEEMEAELLLKAIPVVRRGSVILTLRSAGKLNREFKTEWVAPFSSDQAVSYLKLRFAEQTDKKAMIHLAYELDGRPLALSQAADLIEESGITPGEYLELLQLEKAKEAAMRLKGSSAVDPTTLDYKRPFDAVELTRRLAEGQRARNDSASVRHTDPSRTTKDSGYGSYESGSILQENIEDQEEEAFDLKSIRTLSSFVDLGLDGRLRGINIFASDLAQSLSPDIPEIVESRELVIIAVQDALRAYSYSLEQQNRFSKLSDERKAAHFIRQQSQ
jgi:hypothetical protein